MAQISKSPRLNRRNLHVHPLHLRRRSLSPCPGQAASGRRPASLSPHAFTQLNSMNSASMGSSGLSELGMTNVFSINQRLTTCEVMQLKYLLADRVKAWSENNFIQDLENNGCLQNDMLMLRHALAIIGRTDLESFIRKQVLPGRGITAILLQGKLELVIPRKRQIGRSRHRSANQDRFQLLELPGVGVTGSLTNVDRNVVCNNRVKVLTLLKCVHACDVNLMHNILESIEPNAGTHESMYTTILETDQDSATFWETLKSEVLKQNTKLSESYMEKLPPMDEFKPFMYNHPNDGTQFMYDLKSLSVCEKGAAPEYAHGEESDSGTSTCSGVSRYSRSSLNSQANLSAESSDSQVPSSPDTSSGGEVGSSPDIPDSSIIQFPTSENYNLSKNEYLLYRGDEQIGEGGFGIILKGLREFKGVNVVIKEPKNRGRNALKQFHKEKDRAFLKHLFLLPVIAIHEDMGLLLPWMANGDFGMYLNNRQNHPIKVPEIFRILLQTAGALSYLHDHLPGTRRSMVHGDVKPSNILLDDLYNVRLSDACMGETQEDGKYTTTGIGYGTPAYRSPYARDENSVSGDVFSLGVVVIQILTSKEPVSREIDTHTGKFVEVKTHETVTDICGDDSDLFLEQLMNQKLFSDGNTPELVHILADVGVNCIQRPEVRKSCPEIYRILKDSARSHSIALYQAPQKSNKCLQCCVNDRGDIAVDSDRCDDDCKYFCVQCLSSADRNSLWCPEHGRAQPPIGGKKWHTLLIAGFGTGGEQIIFNKDVEDVEDVFGDPRVVGAKNIDVLTPLRMKRNKDERPMKQAIRERLTHLTQILRDDPTNEGNIIIYYSGHCQTTSSGSALLVGAGTTDDSFLQDSELKEWIAPIYKHAKQVVIVLDCCFASRLQLFPEAKDVGGGVQYLQWCASDRDEKADADSISGSVFTKHLLSGLGSSTTCLLPGNRADDEGVVGACELCEHTRSHARTDGYLDNYLLHKHIERHVHKETNSRQQPYQIGVISNGIKLAYFNEHKLVHTFLFEVTDPGSGEPVSHPLYLSRQKIRVAKMKRVIDVVKKKAIARYLIQDSTDDSDIMIYVNQKGNQEEITDYKTLWKNIDKGNLVHVRTKRK